jgi:hypothetical protein
MGDLFGQRIGIGQQLAQQRIRQGLQPDQGTNTDKQTMLELLKLMMGQMHADAEYCEGGNGRLLLLTATE